MDNFRTYLVLSYKIWWNLNYFDWNTWVWCSSQRHLFGDVWSKNNSNFEKKPKVCLEVFLGASGWFWVYFVPPVYICRSPPLPPRLLQEGSIIVFVSREKSLIETYFAWFFRTFSPFKPWSQFAYFFPSSLQLLSHFTNTKKASSSLFASSSSSSSIFSFTPPRKRLFFALWVYRDPPPSLPPHPSTKTELPLCKNKFSCSRTRFYFLSAWFTLFLGFKAGPGSSHVVERQTRNRKVEDSNLGSYS